MTSYPAAAASNAKVGLLLFVAGQSPNSVAALENLRQAMEAQGEERFRLEIVDVFRSPERALADQVIVTPTLMRLGPAPGRRLIGDLSAHAELIAFLNMQR